MNVSDLHPIVRDILGTNISITLQTINSSYLSVKNQYDHPTISAERIFKWESMLGATSFGQGPKGQKKEARNSFPYSAFLKVLLNVCIFNTMLI